MQTQPSLAACFDLRSRSLIWSEAGPAGRFRPLVRFELGEWTIAGLTRKIAEIASASDDAAERLAAWAEAFIGTPSLPESSLGALGRHEIRVRLESFDCITLVYTCLALARSSTLESFVANLAEIRYAEPARNGVDNCCDEGNFLDFVCESLLTLAVDQGLVSDESARLAAGRGGGAIYLETRLGRHARERKLDPGQLSVRPYFGERRFGRRFIPGECISEAFRDGLRRGDIVLVSKGGDRPTLIHHCYIATARPGPSSYVHASLNGYRFSAAAYARLTEAPEEFPAFQCGVSRGARYAGEEFVVQAPSMRLHPYLDHVDRPVEDAISQSFKAALVLRPC